MQNTLVCLCVCVIHVCTDLFRVLPCLPFLASMRFYDLLHPIAPFDPNRADVRDSSPSFRHPKTTAFDGSKSPSRLTILQSLAAQTGCVGRSAGICVSVSNAIERCWSVIFYSRLGAMLVLSHQEWRKECRVNAASG